MTTSYGLIHSPVVPFAADRSIDYATFERVIAFHLSHGADALAVPMHVAESVSLSDIEQREVLAFVMRQVGTRVPVLAHTSDSGTVIAADRARHAESLGVAAIIATVPYYWSPPQPMVLEHLTTVGAAVSIPYLAWNCPGDMGNKGVSLDIACKLADRLPNFAGVVDSSLDWQYMIDLLRMAQGLKRPFGMISGTDYMVSSGAVGGRGVVSELAGVAPRLARTLHDLCVAEKYFDARAAQERMAAVRQAVRAPGVAGLKSALRLLGRDCGPVRQPVPVAEAADEAKLAAELERIGILRDEPRGW